MPTDPLTPTRKRRTVRTFADAWVGKRVHLSRLALIKCPAQASNDRTAVRAWFYPLTFDEGREWHSREGVVGYGLAVTLARGRIKSVMLAAEFCTCGDHEVAGTAPAWPFPHDPLDIVSPRQLPALVRERIGCVLDILTVPKRPLADSLAWHDETETGWKLPF